MADTLYYSRDTKVWLHLTAEDMFYEIPVLSGFSYSQAQNTSEITLNEAASSAGVSRRGRAVFNDSYAPAEWSFQTYIRPFNTAGGTRGTAGVSDDTATNGCAVEEALWNAFFDDAENGAITKAVGSLTVDLAEADAVSLGTFDLYFELGGNSTNTELIHKVASCSVNELTTDFDLDGIAMITWSGFGSIITDVATIPYAITKQITEGIADTDNYIRNKLTTLTMTNAGSAGRGTIAVGPASTAAVGTNTNFVKDFEVGQSFICTSATVYTVVSITDETNMVTQSGTEADAAYTVFPEGLGQQSYLITLTGGSFTMTNNLVYLTPETIGSVNQPLAHITGPRSISGNFTCYLGSDTAVTTSPADLLEDLLEATTAIQNQYSLAFAIGGATAPKVDVTFAQAHLEVPTTVVEDVMSLDINFHGVPSDIDAEDEVVVVYTGP